MDYTELIEKAYKSCLGSQIAYDYCKEYFKDGLAINVEQQKERLDKLNKKLNNAKTDDDKKEILVKLKSIEERIQKSLKAGEMLQGIKDAHNENVNAYTKLKEMSLIDFIPEVIE